MAPIPLYGKLDEKGNLSLCEIHTDDEYRQIIIHGSRTPVDTSTCPFQLAVTHQSANGKWVSGKRNYDVALAETARLDSTQEYRIIVKVEIPFWGQTDTHSFIGSYEHDGVKVNVINKRSRQVIQVINPMEHECLFGSFMTPIHMNIESYGSRSLERARSRMKCNTKT
jgi:hypothetical protein